jgi:hypothetical protein
MGHEMAGDPRSSALARLDAFVGEWSLAVDFPDGPKDSSGRVTFEWTLGREYLLQRWQVPHPEAPDGMAVISAEDDGDAYVQHYFDSRGVVRVYRMTFRDGLWTLVRDAPDFTPLDFSQRYTGAFSEDGSSIVGRWETSYDGSTWELDFNLTYRRIA